MVSPIDQFGLPTVDSAVSAHSLQALIELVYMQAANDTLYNHLASLQSALGITNEAVKVLTALQNLHNQVNVAALNNLNFNYNEQVGASAYAGQYQSAASAFFGKPIQVSAFFPSGYNAFQTQMLQLKSALVTIIIPNLSATTPLGANGQTDPSSLLATMKKVLQDIDQTTTSESAAVYWIEDNYNSSTNTGAATAGAFQQDITNALTAAQSLNSTQTESVRNYLYLFEEYYKSASAILTQMTQIIQNMAQNIVTS